MARGEPAGSAKGQETREKIRQAAIALLRDEGVVGVTTRRVAQAAGTNQALVHYYFKSIDNLMLDVVERIADGVVAAYADRYPPGRSFSDSWRVDVDSLLADGRNDDTSKVWFEAVAFVVNTEDHLERSRLTRSRPRALLREAIGRDLGDDDEDACAIAVLLSLVRTGLVIDLLMGIREGHEEALDLVQQLLAERFNGTRRWAPSRNDDDSEWKR